MQHFKLLLTAGARLQILLSILLLVLAICLTGTQRGASAAAHYTGNPPASLNDIARQLLGHNLANSLFGAPGGPADTMQKNVVARGTATAPMAPPAAFSGYTITRESSPKIYVDCSATSDSAYVAYNVTNTSGANVSDLWAQLVPSGSVTLSEDGNYHVGALANGASTRIYFYVRVIPCGDIATTTNLTVNLYTAPPPFGPATHTATFGYTVTDDIKASANKLDAVFYTPNPPAIGGLATINARGFTGNIGANAIFAPTPASKISWPADTFKLFDVRIRFFNSPANVSGCDYTNPALTSTFDDTLFIQNSAPITSGNAVCYIIDYVFLIERVYATNIPVSPLTWITSGTPVKHNDLADIGSSFLPPDENYTTLNKTANPASATSGGTLTYALTATNTSTVDVMLSSFKDTLPPGMSYSAGTSTYNNGAGAVAIPDPLTAGQMQTWSSLFRVPASGTATLTFQAVLPANVTCLSFTNSAVAFVGDGVGAVQIDTTLNPTDNSPATATVADSACNADLAVTKTDGVTSYSPGNVLTYTIVVSNNGAAHATGASVADMVPAALTGLTVNCTPTGTASCGSDASAGNNVSFSGISINAGAGNFLTITISGTVNAGTTGNLVNTAMVTAGGQADPTPGNNSATDTNAPNPALTKSFAPASFTDGGKTTLTFTLDNSASGAVAQSGLAFTDTLPGGLLVATPPNIMNPTCGGTVTAAAGGTTIALSGGSAVANGTCTFSVDVTNAAGQTNAACPNANFTNGAANISGLAGNLTNSVQPGCVTVAPKPLLTKSFAPASFTDGGKTTLTFTLDNTASGSAAQSGLTFTDTLPGNLRVATPANIVGTCGGAVTATAGGTTIALSGGSVAANSSCTLSVDVTNVAGQTNTSCQANPAAFTNSSTNISGLASNLTNNVQPNCVLVAPKPLLAKAFAPTTFTDGGTTTLTFTIDNTAAGASNQSSLAFTDTLPTSLRVATPANLVGACGGMVTATAGGATIALSGGSVSAGGTCTFSLDVTNVAGQTNISCAGNPAAFTNSAANISGLASNLSNSVSASCVLVAPKPLLSKSFSPIAFTDGGKTTLTFTVNNTAAGSSAQSSLAFTDTLPGSLRVATPANIAGACGGAVTATNGSTSIAMSGGSVGAGVSCSFSVDVTNVAQQTNTSCAANPAAFTNSSTNISGLAGNLTNNVQPQCVLVNAQMADLSLTKAVNNPTPNVGNNVVFTITVTNHGPDSATGVAVKDQLSAGYLYVSDDGGGAYNSGSGVWTVGTLANPQTKTLHITAMVNLTGPYTNTAQVSSADQSDPNSTPNNNDPNENDQQSVTTVPVAGADLAVQKNGPAAVAANGQMTYTIRVSNAGPLNANGATLTDTLPAALTGAAWTCHTETGGASCGATTGNGNINTTIMTFPVGGSVTYTVTGTAPATGIFGNTATVTPPAGVLDPDPANNSSSVATAVGPVLATANLAAIKSGPSTVAPHGAVTYQIVVTNAGPGAANAATFTDPAPLSGVTWTCGGETAGASCGTANGAGGINTTIAALPAGASVTFTVRGTAPASGSLVNTATIMPPPGVTDPDTSNNTSTVTTAVQTPTATADLYTIKTGPATVFPGASVSYTVIVGNSAALGTTNALFTENVPAVLTGVTWTCGSPTGGANCGVTSGSGNTISTLIASLPAHSTVTFTVTGSAPAAGSFVNSTTITPPVGTIDSDPTDNIGGPVVTNIVIICLPFSFVPLTLPNATVGALYGQWLTAYGGSAPYVFALMSGALPNGLTLLPDGLLAGTPQQSGPFNFMVKATDTNGCTGTIAYNGVVACPAITVQAPPAATAGTFYSHTMSATPAGGNYTFAVSSGMLPNGLTLTPAGLLSGTVMSAGSYPFTITATGWGNQCSNSQAVNLIVNCPTIALTPSLPNGVQGTTYNQTVTATPAGTPYTYALTTNVLPPGLTLNSATGAITGIPSAPGNYAFTITATGWGGCPKTQSYNLLITGTCETITLNPTSLPAGSGGLAYNQTITASSNGGGGPYTFAVTQGALPLGLALNAGTGVLTGNPAQAGFFSFRITATGPGGCTASRSYALTINCGTLSFAPSALPDGVAGTYYTPQQITITPAGNYTFSILLGQLPPGYTLGAQSGIISGAANVPGYYTFTLKVTGVGGCNGTVQYSIRIVCPAITLNPATLPNGTVNVPYSQTISGAPATQPGVFYSYAVVAGALPPGFTLNSTTGVLSGTTSSGSYSFTLKATGFTTCLGTRAYTLVIHSPATALALSADYDGDGRSDLALWSAKTGSWRIVKSSNQQAVTQSWGTLGDVSLLGDYDGDGQTDLAVFRPANGTWYVKRSSDGSSIVKAWGLPTDVPVPGDYDGDGKTDIAVWRPSEGHWYVVRSSDQQYTATAWGAGYAPYNDITVPGDYDGDGKTDLAVFRRATGAWLVKRSSDGQIMVKAWGLGTDVPVAADYDGDGRTDCAVWRGSSWYIWQSASNSYRATEWGLSAAPYYDQAAPGDYDGDGLTDVAVYRTADQTWYIRSSADSSVLARPLGQAGDTPVSARPR